MNDKFESINICKPENDPIKIEDFHSKRHTIGEVVQLTSCDWIVWNGLVWRLMTHEEQLKYSE